MIMYSIVLSLFHGMAFAPSLKATIEISIIGNSMRFYYPPLLRSATVRKFMVDMKSGESARDLTQNKYQIVYVN